MSMASHLEELKKRHSELDDRIGEEMARPSADPAEITALKRRKLALKDEIQRLRLLSMEKPTRH